MGDPWKWMDHLPHWHPGSCRWFNHPIHVIRQYVVWFLSKVAP